MSADDSPSRRGNWYLLTGILIGLGLGLVYAWVLAPAKPANPTPASLRSDFKDQYRRMIASAYQSTGDLVRARSRLALLDDPDPVRALSEQAQRMLQSGNTDSSALALAELAQEIQQPAPAGNPPSPSNAVSITPEQAGPSTSLPPGSPSNSRSRPTPTPTITPGAPFALIKQEKTCDPALAEGLLQVELKDAAGQAVPGAELIITWKNGEDHFFTGLMSEMGDGYADYRMTPNVIYSLQVASTSSPVSDLTPPNCSSPGGKSYWGGISLVFQQP